VPRTSSLVVLTQLVALPAVLLLSGCGAATPPSPDGSAGGTTTAPDENSSNAAGGVVLPEQTVGAEPDCSLYSVDELEAVWGVSFVDFDPGTVLPTSDGGVFYSCDYNETDSGLGLTFDIEYRDFATVEGAQQDIANVRDGAAFGDTVYFVNTEVEGVGDEAFFSDPSDSESFTAKNQRQLYARFGNVVLLVSAVNLDGAAPDYGDKILESVALHF
jgi:hypothetical protein